MGHVSIPALFGLLLALGLGLLVGRATAPPAVTALKRPASSTGFDEARLVDILAVPDLRQRGPLLLALLDDLTPEDLPSVRASYESLRPNLDANAILALMDWWARFDPEAALAFAQSFGDISEIATIAVVRRWAQSDPTSAREQLEDSNATRSQPRAVLALVRGWVESGHPGVWGYVESLPIGALRQQAIAVLIHQRLLREAPESVTRFVEALPDHGAHRFKLQAFRQTAAALALRHPEAATAWAERHADGPFGDSLLFKVALGWAFLDAEPAVHWLANLPAGDDQRDAMRTAYGFWLQQDRERARTWLRESGESRPALETAWSLLALDIGREDPEAGLELLFASNIEEDLREKTSIALALTWLRMDHDAAQAWLDVSGLPENVIQEIRTARPPRRRRAPARTQTGQAPAPADAPTSPAR